MVSDLVTVHLWDQRGGGRSTRAGPYTVARFVEDLEVLRNHLRYEQWMVGGHSWGAALALMYALTHPQRVKALTYMSGVGLGHEWQPAFDNERRRRLTSAQLRRLDELKPALRTESEEREFLILSWSTNFANRSRAAGLAEGLLHDYYPINYECNRMLVDELRAWNEGELATRCRELSMPVLVLHGSEDPRPTWALDSLVAALPDVTYILLPGVGHVPWLEKPRLLRAALRTFIATRLS